MRVGQCPIPEHPTQSVFLKIFASLPQSSEMCESELK